MRYDKASRVAGVLLAIAVACLTAATAHAKRNGTEVANEHPPSGRGLESDDRGGRNGSSGRDDGSDDNGGTHNDASSSGSNSGSSNHGGDDAVSNTLDGLSSGKHGDSDGSHGLPIGSHSTSNSGPGSKASVVIISDEDRL